ncbi:MAG: bacterial Ig-like domain-containing protein [Bacteroidaceae bacterium]|nr:bacterial Ig-like domain-containing protein [Bacteroidaceae bacterium]
MTVNSSAGSFTTYYGTAEHPTSGTTVGNGFFTVVVGGATGRTSSIVVVFEKGNTPSKPLSSIAVSGTPTKTTYYDGDKFSTDGLTVTGTYSDNTTETLTSGVTWNVTPETLTTGTTSVSVTAMVGEKTSASYTVNGLTVNAIPEKTIAEFIAAEGGKCYLTGVVSNIKNTTYGNYDLTDESGTIYVYGTLTSAGVSAQFASLDVEENDRIKVLAESYELYGSTPEAKNVIFVENLGSVGPSLSSIAVSGTPDKTAYYEGDLFSPAGLVVTGTYSDASTKDLTGKAEWTITPSTGLTLGMTSVSVVATVDEVSSAAFTVEGLVVSEKPLMYEVDFESATDDYTDWVFTNFTSKATHSSVTAHGGSNFGTTGGKATGSLQTKNKVAFPNELTFYVSKQTSNNTASIWKVEVSANGTDWTSVKEQSAISMNAGTWVKVSQDLSSYKDVYVRIYYTGTTAVRCIDDVTLTYSKPFPVTFRKAGNGYSTLYTSETALTIPEGVEAYYCTLKDNGNMDAHELTDVIPASTPVVLHYTGELTDDKTINFAHSIEEGEDASANVLKGTDDALDITSITDNDFYVLSIVDGQVGFYKFGGDALAAGKAYYMTAKAPAGGETRGFILDFGFDEGNTTGVCNVQTIAPAAKASFDLQGRRVMGATKGLVIKNGRVMLNR